MDVDNLFLSPGDPTIMEYMRECLDTGREFDLSVLLTDPETEETNTTPPETPKKPSTDPPPTDKTPSPTQKTTIPLSIDLLLSTTPNSPPRPSHTLPYASLTTLPSLSPPGRATSVHSAAALLLQFLSTLSEPVVPYAMYNRCVQEAYHTFVAARNVIQHLPSERFNVFVYLVGFLREVLEGWRGRGDLGAERVAQIFAPIIVRTPPTTTTTPTSFSITSPTPPTLPARPATPTADKRLSKPPPPTPPRSLVGVVGGVFAATTLGGGVKAVAGSAGAGTGSGGGGGGVDLQSSLSEAASALCDIARIPTEGV
ncbi:hypothetical protein HDV00_011549 [Rhizophlyctis rosea]|nr:hypothetical protein HDV00_011549 [Rhizophlyctis rosea]